MKLDDDNISGAVRKQLASAETWSEGDLAEQQAENLEFYYGEPLGNEIDGFSKVVTRDVLETVEGIMPELMKIFAGTDTFVEFDPFGPEDVEAAEQATDYVNYIFDKRAKGFTVLYTWFKDALLMKNGLVKVGWEDKERVEIHTLEGLTEDEVEAFESAEDVSSVEYEEEEDGTFSIKIYRIKQKGEPYVAPIPSEEFRITARSTSICDADFVAHVTEKKCGDLIAAGYDEDKVKEGARSVHQISSTVANARHADVDEEDWDYSHDEVVEVIHACLEVYDEDEKRTTIVEVMQIGDEVLEWEEVESKPFINLSPIMMPHKFTGVSVADLVKDIQMIRSQLYRQILDNNALQNAGRYAAVDGQVNLQDLMDNQIGGIVREKVSGAVRQLPTPALSQATFPMLGEMEQERSDRTGVNDMSQGLDPNALTSNTAATSVNQIMTAAQQKILLIARIFAETGVKELFLQLYKLARTNQTEGDMVKLRGQFVEVRPFDWADRYDMTVTVGIGNGNKDQQLYHLNNIQAMLQAVGNTEYAYLVSAENVFNTAGEVIKNAGYKDPEFFIGDPANVPPPPPPPPSPEMIAAEAEAEKDRADAQYKMAQAQNLQLELQIEQQKLQLAAQEFDWRKKKEAAELGLEATQKRPVAIGDNQLGADT